MSSHSQPVKVQSIGLLNQNQIFLILICGQNIKFFLQVPAPLIQSLLYTITKNRNKKTTSFTILQTMQLKISCNLNHTMINTYVKLISFQYLLSFPLHLENRFRLLEFTLIFNVQISSNFACLAKMYSQTYEQFYLFT